MFPTLANRSGAGRNGLSRAFERIMERAGIKSRLIRQRTGGKSRSLRGLSSHSFRHSAASAVFNQAALREITRRVTNHARREILRGHLARLPLIVPNPMLGVFGHTKVANRKSQHTLEQTAARVYLVIEFDFSEFARDGRTPSIWAPLVRGWQRSGTRAADACAALHLHLANHLPLVAVVHSGGKSLHGWYYVFRRPEADLRVFMDCAVSLGADHATWSRSQFVRLPDGLRENGKRQTTYYLNPAKAVRNE